MLSRSSAQLGAASVAFIVALCLLAISPLNSAFAADGVHKPIDTPTTGGQGGHSGGKGGGHSGGWGGGQGGGQGQGGPGGGGQGGGSIDDTSSGSGDDEKSLGSVNPLDIHNPLCDQKLKPGEERNCENTGSPETRYPTSNYGLEEHIDDSGSAGDTIRGSFQVMLVQIANAIWMATLFVLNLVLTLLGWAFELNPFSDNSTMREVSDSLERFYRAFTSPWIVVAFTCLGVWGMWKGIFRREVAASIGGMAASLLLMVGGLIVLHQPRDTVGVVSNASDNAAQTLIGAPLNGSLNDPAGSYASATRSTWNAMTMPGFAALNFTDVGWALSKPEPEILEIADESVCLDYLYGGEDGDWLTNATENQATLAATGKCSDGTKVPRPETNAEIWLRSSTGSDTRQRLWDEVTDGTEWSHYLSIQGGGGAWTRLPLVILIALGLLGGILLLGWLAVRLLMQTAVAFVMLLATPLALFMPAFGDRGRAAFLAWATTLLGALLSKLVYAGLLAVVLFATNTVATLAGDSGGLGTMTAFLIMAGLWWAVFLKRETLLSFLSVSGVGADGGGRDSSGFLGSYMKYRAASAVIGAVPGLGGGRGGDRQGGGYLGSGGGDAALDDPVARNEAQLDKSAEQRLDGQYEDAERTLQAGHGLQDLDRRHNEVSAEHSRLGSLINQAHGGGEGAPTMAELDAAHGGASGSAESELARLGSERRVLGEKRALERQQVAAQPSAAALVGGADRNHAKTGRRWTPEQLRGAREEMRKELNESADSSVHAWRVGMSPQRYDSLGGAEREDARRKVAASVRSDKAAFGTISERPAGAVGSPPSRSRGRAETRAGKQPTKQLRRQERPMMSRREWMTDRVMRSNGEDPARREERRRQAAAQMRSRARNLSR